MGRIALQSKDNVVIYVEEKAARLSPIINAFLNAIHPQDDLPIPVQQVDGQILKLLFSWAEAHQNDPTETNLEMSNWDMCFFSSLQVDTMFQMLTYSLHLDMKPLYEMTCDALERSFYFSEYPNKKKVQGTEERKQEIVLVDVEMVDSEPLIDTMIEEQIKKLVNEVIEIVVDENK